VTRPPDPVRQSLQSAVRTRLRRALPPARDPVRSRPAAADGRDAEETWAVLRRERAPLLEAPTRAGGLELGLSIGSVVAEELGRAGLDGRYLAVALAVDAATSGEDPPEKLVGRLAGGDLSVALAGFESAGAPVRAAADGADLCLAGRLAVDAPGELAAAALLAPVALDGGGTALVLLDPATVPVREARHPSGAGGLATLDGVRCARESLLYRWDGAAGCPDEVLGRARVRQAAYLLGLAHGALVTAVRRATGRRQFGRPLREFQHVSFRLATGYVQVEALRAAVADAVWLADHGHPFGRRGTEVLAEAAETAVRVAGILMQVCGVRGLTGELDAHRYYLRIRRESGRLGRAAALWREAGRARLADAADARG